MRIYNSNIDDILFQELRVRDGAPRIAGDFVNAGVPGAGSEIFTDFSRAIGRRTGAMLPTGRVKDRIVLSDGRTVEASLLDVGNPVAYVPAGAFGLTGTEMPDVLLSTPGLLATIGEIRRHAAELMGLAGKFSVRVGLVSPAATYIGADGEVVAADSMDCCGRFFALDYCAPSYPGSASSSTGAAARVRGSVIHDILSDQVRAGERVRIGHPLGVMDVLATTRPADAPGGIVIERLGFGRTARAIMEGVVFVPRADLQPEALV